MRSISKEILIDLLELILEKSYSRDKQKSVDYVCTGFSYIAGQNGKI